PPDRAQPTSQTPPFWADCRSSSKASAGVFQPRVLRGLLLSVAGTASISAAFQRERAVPLGEYLRSRPVVFSFVPRCQGLCGSAKKTGMPVSTLNAVCADSSLPRSHVNDRRSCLGSVPIVAASAFFMVTAPEPARAGP